MSPIGISINAAFARHENNPSVDAIEQARRQGYEFFEPSLTTGPALLAHDGYYHFLTLEQEPEEVRAWLAAAGLKPSGVTVRAPLMRPDVCVPYMHQAIHYAAALGAPLVTTDEGCKPAWMSEETAWEMMRYSLRLIARSAERSGVSIAIASRGTYTSRIEGLLRMMELVPSPWLRISFDTGKTLLADVDPGRVLKQVVEKVIHVHAQDVTFHTDIGRDGRISRTLVGCACGDGLVDWRQIIDILDSTGYTGVLSVQCKTVSEAERSILYLRQLLQHTLIGHH